MRVKFSSFILCCTFIPEIGQSKTCRQIPSSHPQSLPFILPAGRNLTKGPIETLQHKLSVLRSDGVKCHTHLLKKVTFSQSGFKLDQSAINVSVRVIVRCFFSEELIIEKKKCKLSSLSKKQVISPFPSPSYRDCYFFVTPFLFNYPFNQWWTISAHSTLWGLQAWYIWAVWDGWLVISPNLSSVICTSINLFSRFLEFPPQIWKIENSVKFAKWIWNAFNCNECEARVNTLEYMDRAWYISMFHGIADIH